MKKDLLSEITHSSLSSKTLSKEGDIKKIQPYLKGLKKALEDNDVTNIALTGAYGSGKSTILNTFQSRNDNYEYINISLATFKDEIELEENGIEEGEVEEVELEKKIKKNKYLDRNIELSILQQIFYHVNPSEIPDSRFKRIKSISDKEIRVISLGVVVWILATITLFKYQFITKLNPQNWTFSFSSISIITIIASLIFFTGIGIVISKLIRYLNNSKISKINFLKGELEVGKNIDKSIFNEHLDEILYFFENTNYDVIVIEDIDRFKNTEVFTKLREINLLLNNAKSILRKIKFVYAIRDDIFKNEERTKFFDYIIPVIPFINQASANEQLNKLINEAGLQHDFTDDFKDGVVTFIDEIDMRLLTNIFHEYTIYKESLKGGKLIQDNLFALMIYKNIHPKDFVDLSRDKGDLYTFIKNKNKYIKGFFIQIDKEIEKIENKIARIQSEQVKNVRELRAIYLNAIQGKIPEAINIVLENEDYNFYELNEDDNFISLHDQIKITYKYNRSYSPPHYTFTSKTSEISFSDIEELVNSNFTYQEREQFIIDRDNEKIEDFQIQIQGLRNDKNEIESWSLKKIFEKIDITPYLNSFSNSNLMRSLILNGYIDENYNHYITLFHGVNISHADYDFEQNVKRGVSDGFDFKLSRVKNLVKRIPVKFFKRKEILNYEVLAFILNHKDKNKDRYKSILSLLISERHGTKEAFDIYRFIKGYLFDFKIDESEHKGFANKNVKLFINELSKKSDNFWGFISSHSAPKIEKEQFLKLIIKYVDIEIIATLNQKRSIKNFMSQSEDFLSTYEDLESQKVASVIQKLEIKIKKLTPPTKKTQKLFDFIYEYNYYEINIDNLSLLLKKHDSEFNESNFNEKNYSSILDSKIQPIITYISENMDYYIEHVMLEIESNNYENENSLVKIYNDENIKDKLKIRLLKKQEILISDLSKMTEESISPNFIEQSKITNNWNNVFTYFKYSLNKIDEILVEYLNKESNYEELSKSVFDVDEKHDKEFIEVFSLSLIRCNELEYDSYIDLLKSIPSAYNEWETLDFEMLDSNKVKFLIENGFISLSINNYTILEEHFDLHILLLEKHRFLFATTFNNYDISDDDILLLLKSKVLSDSNKVDIIEKLDDEVIINNQNIGRLVCNLLANSKLIPLSFNVIESLFNHSISIEDRIKLLNLHFDELSRDQVKQLLGLVNRKYNSIFKLYGKPRLDNTKYNQTLANNLLQNKYISSKKDVKDKIKIYAFNK